MNLEIWQYLQINNNLNASLDYEDSEKNSIIVL